MQFNNFYCNFRTSEFVRTWYFSPDESTNELLSMSSDNLYTIITGTNNDQVVLWDQRQSFPLQVCITFKFYVSCILLVIHH
jgi:hypothetical protein